MPTWCYDLWYFGHRGLMRSYFALRSRVRVSGRENVPASGPFIVASNHVTKYDPTFLMNAIPRQIRFMAKSELWDAPWSRRYMLIMRCIAVRRGGSDRRAIQQVLSLLSEGHVVGIFVEGERRLGERLHYIHPGAAMLSIRSGAPVLPVVLLVSGRDVEVRIGEPLRFQAGPAKMSKSAQYDAFSDRLATTLVELSGHRLQYAPHVRAQEVEEGRVDEPLDAGRDGSSNSPRVPS